jgi:nucleotide-binding universal stress UspA family protein
VGSGQHTLDVMHTVRPAPPDPETPVLHDVPSSAPHHATTEFSDNAALLHRDVPTSAEPGRRLAPAPRPATDAGPLSARRPHPWLLVIVDDSPSSYAGLVWALREAARREATVVAVGVAEQLPGDLLIPGAAPEPRTRQAELEACVQRARAEIGTSVPVRTAVLDAAVVAALTAAASGADLVVVGASGKRLLRPAVPRTPVRRFARGA